MGDLGDRDRGAVDHDDRPRVGRVQRHPGAAWHRRPRLRLARRGLGAVLGRDRVCLAYRPARRLLLPGLAAEHPGGTLRGCPHRWRRPVGTLLVRDLAAHPVRGADRAGGDDRRCLPPVRSGVRLHRRRAGDRDTGAAYADLPHQLQLLTVRAGLCDLLHSHHHRDAARRRRSCAKSKRHPPPEARQ